MEKRLLSIGILGCLSLLVLLTLLTFVSAEVINCYSNSDCFSGYIGNEYCMNNDVYKVFQNSSCINPGNPSSYCNNLGNPTLIVDCGTDSWDSWSANYCKNNNVYHSRNGIQRGCKIIDADLNISGCFFEYAFEEALVQTCSNGCNNGVCNQVVINCFSSADCGIDGYLGADYCFNDDVYDYFKYYICNNAGTISSSCSFSSIPSVKTDCGNNYCEDYGSNYCKVNDVYHLRNCHSKGCLNGGCFDNINVEETLVQTCSNGCLNSNCIIGNIICYNNVDCGTNSYIGDLFCQSGNVYQNFISFSCLNPGTTQSYCNNFTSPLLNQTCLQGQTCSNGQCVNVNINCSNNADCGSNGYIGDKYCDNHDVYQDYKEYQCNNPGNANSYCSDSVSSRLIEECSYDCSDGECAEKEHRLNYGFNDSEPYSYPGSVNFSGFGINESVQKISGNVIKLENESSLNKILGDNLLLILIVLIIIIIILIIVLSLMK